MTDDLRRAFAELNPVADPDRLVALDAPDLPADPVLRAVLEHAHTDNGRPTLVRPAEVQPDQQPTTHPRSRTLAAVGAAAAVILAMVAGLVVVNYRQPAPVASQNAVTLYGDGDISCPNHVADDESRPVGTVEYHPEEGQIRVIVRLTDAAPHAVYGVELWIRENCEPSFGAASGDRSARMTTDGNGAGELDHVFAGIDPQTYRVNVNLVTGADLDDPRHREIGAAVFTEVVVGGNGGD